MARAAPPTSPRRQAPTLTAYLARRFALYLVLTLAVLAAFSYLIDVVDLLGKAGGKGISGVVVMQMSLIKLPDLMQQMLPFAVLLATLITLNQLNRTQELVALRATGLPARRILLGPLLVVLLVGAFALTILNPLAATMLKRYERWQNETFPGSARGLVTAGGNIWLKQHERGYDLFIYGRKVQGDGKRMDGVTVFVFEQNGAFRSRLDGEEMTLEPGQWRMTNVMMLAPDRPQVSGTTAEARGTIRHEDSVVMPTDLTPSMIQSSFNPPGTLSVWELRGFIAMLRQTGFPSSPHEMAYQRMLALPALLVAMFLLGVPFALAFVRNRSLGVAVGAGLGFGFGFYLFGNAMAAFGLAGRLDVTLAAWLPTLIAMLVAVALLIHLREE